MNDAKKLLSFLIALIIGVAFLNRGQLTVSSTPSGASANVGFFGLVK